MRELGEILEFSGILIFLFLFGMYEMRKIDRYFAQRKGNIRKAEETIYVVSEPKNGLKTGNDIGEAVHEHII